ncbi:HTH domain-containing protein [Candidatus Woesearchaeota archaeon]|nr:HTH domain-containing protein [Candidatus Woesearchaeota archaeon]MBW3021974.1 HTH domain-containing protein [Candidatus Woesearchaeota archaeon]
MIDFACKRFQLRDVIKCALGLSKADLRLMQFLMESDEWHTTDVLAKKLNLNLSTIQRGVKKLYEKKVLLRSQTNLDQGGYVFNYKIKPKPALRDLIMDIVNNWVKTLGTELNTW